MIGGRIFDDTVLVGFALGRSVYVLAAGKLACPGCAAPHEARDWPHAATRRAAATIGARTERDVGR